MCWHDKKVQSCTSSRKQAPRIFIRDTIVPYNGLSTTSEHVGLEENVGALTTCEDIHEMKGKVIGAIRPELDHTMQYRFIKTGQEAIRGKQHVYFKGTGCSMIFWFEYSSLGKPYTTRKGNNNEHCSSVTLILPAIPS